MLSAEERAQPHDLPAVVKSVQLVQHGCVGRWSAGNAAALPACHYDVGVLAWLLSTRYSGRG